MAEVKEFVEAVSLYGIRCFNTLNSLELLSKDYVIAFKVISEAFGQKCNLHFNQTDIAKRK